MKKFILLFAATLSILAACTNDNSSDDQQLTPSPFAGTFNGLYTLTSVAQPQGKPASVVVTDNPDGSLQYAISVDGQTANLQATLNGQKIVFAQQTAFGATHSGYGEMPATDQLHLVLNKSAVPGQVSELEVWEFNGNR